MSENHAASAKHALSPAIGGGIAGVGLLCFIGALAYALRTPPENPEVATVQKAIGESTEKLAAARAETPQLSNQTASLREQQAKLKGENDALENTIQERNVKLDKLQNERTALLAAAQKQQNEASEAAFKEQRELLLKNATQLNQAELQRALTSYQKMLVTILSEEGHLGTGFYYDCGNGAIIVSPLPNARRNLKLIMKVNVVVDTNNGSTTTVTAVGRVLYVDHESGLSFISANFPSSVPVHAFDEKMLGKAAAGDKVYALSMQVAGDRVLDNNVMDGDVSSTDRREGNYTYLQIAMAANPGMCGGPLIGRDGRLIGIMVGAAPGLERTSFAIRSSDLPWAAARFKDAPVPRAEAPQQLPDAQPQNPLANRNDAPAIDPARADAAARQHPLPYKKEEALTLGMALDQHSMMTVNGPDGLLITINTLHAKLAAYRPRIPTPSWEHAVTGRVDLAYVVGSNQMLEIPEFNDKRSTLKTIDLRTGIATPRGGKFPTNMGRCIELSNGFYFVPGNGYGCQFVDSSTGNSITATSEHVIGYTTDRAFVMRQDRELGYFDLSSVLGLHQQINTLDQQLRNAATARDTASIQRIAAQEQDLRNKIQSATKTFNADLSEDATGLVFQIGSDHFLIGYELWEIKPAGVRKLGTLPKRDHSAMAEAWFEGFYPARLRVGQNPIHPIAVSSNGKWALSQTHLFNLADFQIAAELPVPVQHGGILTDNKTLWLFDNISQTIYFLDIATLTGGKAP